MHNRPIYFILLCFSISILLSQFTLIREGIPSAIVHDEYSYLLAADTFASGQLANPTHPKGEFFETFHVLMEPVYASKYMPGQGLVLALGQLVFGEPIYGAIFSTAFLCAAICWMLQGYFNNEFALIGGLIASINFSLYHYWSYSYWGGAIPALGAVLVFGSIIRITQRKLLASYLCGIGICLLMLTRPFEGFFFCLVPAIVLLLWWIKEGFKDAKIWLQLVLPIVSMMLLCISFILYNNYTLTGDCFVFAQSLYGEQTVRTPLFVWDSHTNEPSFAFDRMKQFYESWILPRLELRDSLLHRFLYRLSFSSQAFVGKTLFCLPLLGLLLPLTRSRLWIRIILLINGTMLIVVYPIHPHYAAPLVVVAYFLFVDFIQTFSTLINRRLFFLLLACFCLLFVFMKVESSRIYYQRDDLLSHRRNIEKELVEKADKNLVFVTYQNYNVHSEWVYNKADIDASEVIWARSLGIEKNQELLGYYPDRRTWMFLAINNQIKLIPYDEYIKLETEAQD